MNCKNTRSCCSPCSALAQQLEETNTRAVQAYNLAETAMQRIDSLPISDAVLSVNGQLPDQDGEVTVDVGVKTVNTIAPDSDGDFTISAGTNVTITPTTNGVEIEAEGGSPEAIDPIYIDADGKIAFKGWTQVSGYQWAYLKEDNQTTTDILLYIGSWRRVVYIPKGTATNQYLYEDSANMNQGIYTDSANIRIMKIGYQLGDIISNSYSMSNNVAYISQYGFTIDNTDSPNAINKLVIGESVSSSITTKTNLFKLYTR